MYGKIFEDIFYSSLMFSMGWQAVYVFSSMIVIADKDGLVKTDPRALYRLIGMEADNSIKFSDFLNIIRELENPDASSNLTAYDGCRIIPLSRLNEVKGDRGWLVANYAHYLIKGSKIERVKYQKDYYNNVTKNKGLDDKVNKTLNDSTIFNSSQHSSTDSIHIDIDKDIDIDKIKRSRFAPPSLKEVSDYCQERGNNVDPQKFIDHYETNGWVRGKTKIKSWKACVRTWESKEVKQKSDKWI